MKETFKYVVFAVVVVAAAVGIVYKGKSAYDTQGQPKSRFYARINRSSYGEKEGIALAERGTCSLKDKYEKDGKSEYTNQKGSKSEGDKKEGKDDESDDDDEE